MKLLVSTVVLLALVCQVQAQNKHTISGVVLKSDGKPLGGADVRLVVLGKSTFIKSQTSDKDTGKFTFKDVQIDGTFDIVYTHTKYDQSTVPHLANQDNQNICKVLYEKNEKRSASALHDFYRSLNRFHFLVLSADKDGKATLLTLVPKDYMKLMTEKPAKELVDSGASDDVMMFLETERRNASSFKSVLP